MPCNPQGASLNVPITNLTSLFAWVQIRGVVEIRELMLSKHAVLPDSVYARGRPSGTLPQQAWRWGLSQTVEFVLGRRLDKSLQKSNWAHRPLSDAQVPTRV